jgi:hypothetical protein
MMSTTSTSTSFSISHHASAVRMKAGFVQTAATTTTTTTHSTPGQPVITSVAHQTTI